MLENPTLHRESNNYITLNISTKSTLTSIKSNRKEKPKKSRSNISTNFYYKLNLPIQALKDDKKSKSSKQLNHNICLLRKEIISPNRKKKNSNLGDDISNKHFNGFFLNSPNKTQTNFEFSKRNYCPRINNFSKDLKPKINPNFNYYSSDYLPSTISPRKNLITMMDYSESELKNSYESLAKCPYIKKNDSYSSAQFSSKHSRYPPQYERHLLNNPVSNFAYKECQENKFNVNSFNDNLSTKSTSPNLPILNKDDSLTKEKINIVKKSSYTNVNNNNNDEYITKKLGTFVERQGDWICMRCKNLNFSFRVVCNRCKIPKADSENLYEGHLQSLLNLVKYNELLHNQIINLNQNQLFQQGANTFKPNIMPHNNYYAFSSNETSFNQ